MRVNYAVRMGSGFAVIAVCALTAWITWKVLQRRRFVKSVNVQRNSADEGTSQGRVSGKSWVGGETPGGRFCNVFKFRDGRISSLHVYLDPDYTGDDEARFRWGKNRQW